MPCLSSLFGQSLVNTLPALTPLGSRHEAALYTPRDASQDNEAGQFTEKLHWEAGGHAVPFHIPDFFIKTSFHGEKMSLLPKKVLVREWEKQRVLSRWDLRNVRPFLLSPLLKPAFLQDGSGSVSPAASSRHDKECCKPPSLRKAFTELLVVVYSDGADS